MPPISDRGALWTLRKCSTDAKICARRLTNCKRSSTQHNQTSMARARKRKKDLPQSTAQQLASIVKSCRDIMRKDKGFNGDLDRLPMLTWIMFLKFLDDMENIRQRKPSLLENVSALLWKLPTDGATGLRTRKA